MASTKDLREMCQNGVTLDDLRRLYGVNTTLEDLELVLPSPLIGDLGILPCGEAATTGLSESEEESEDVEGEEMNPSEDVKDEECESDEEYDPSEDVKDEDEECDPSEDVKDEAVSASQVEKSKEALPLDQQEAREIEPQVPSFYDPLLYTVPWHPLLALCILSQPSNVLDVLTSLEILSRLT